MKPTRFLLLLTAFCLTFVLTSGGKAADETAAEKCYELRIYFANDGKLDALNTRFRDHTTRLFSKHGMTNLGYWVPIDNPENKLIYLLSYADLNARETSWKAFQNDPQWISAKSASEAGGELVKKMESRLLGATDFSPPMTAPDGKTAHIFEMRTYTASAGNLPNLLERFRKHTVGLFSKHGMKHFGYFVPLKDQLGHEDTLIYFLIHTSQEAHAASFAAFGADSNWQTAKAASEKAASGSLTTADGVKSQLLLATDYSPAK